MSARNPVHSVLFLILCFVNAAGLFILIGAEFLGLILVLPVVAHSTWHAYRDIVSFEALPEPAKSADSPA